MYIYNKKILFSDVDSDSKITVDGIINSMQDCINLNSEAIGKGIDFIKSNKRTWFTIGWCIYLKRRPKLFEDIAIMTWPYDFMASMGYRNVVITDSKGEDIVWADSIWTLMDMEEGKPVKITDNDIQGYDLEPRYPMDKVNRKIKCISEFEKVDEISVKKCDIDFNGHMSNAKYIQIANEYVPLDYEIKRIRVEYKQQSVYGEKIDILLSNYQNDDEDIYVVKFVGKDEVIKAIVEFLG